MAIEGSPPSLPVVQQELGTLEVDDRVFRDIVERVVLEMSGMARISRSQAGLFRRGSTPIVRVERGQAEVAISMAITVRYEVSIPDVVAELRRRVVGSLEEATGYKVRAVNVAIDRILAPAHGSQGPPENQVPGPPPIPEQE